MHTLENSEDPDEMPHNAAFHHGLSTLVIGPTKKNMCGSGYTLKKNG